MRTLLAIGALVLASQAFGQQTYVGHYDVYGGFMYLNSPYINLQERGFHTQGGVRLRKWLTVGADYSVGNGHTSLTPSLLKSSLQQQLGTTFAQLVALHVVPPGYNLTVPIDSTTQNFAAGPQFSDHYFRALTLFIRPSAGAVHETATPHPQDPIATLVVSQLLPSGKKEEWTAFYGFGGGADINVTEHFALRVQFDFVHDHLFPDLLNSRNTLRLSIGPALQFGRNRVEK